VTLAVTSLALTLPLVHLSGMARGRNKVNDTQADQIPYS